MMKITSSVLLVALAGCAGGTIGVVVLAVEAVLVSVLASALPLADTVAKRHTSSARASKSSSPA